MSSRKTYEKDTKEKITRFASDRKSKSEELLRQLRDMGEIDTKTFNELTMKNETLYHRLIRLASSWEQLSQYNLIRSVEELTRTVPKPRTEEEVILAVKNVICEDSRNVRIREVAAKLERTYSISNNLPSPPPLGIHTLYELPPYVVGSYAPFIEHCNGIALYIAKWVCENIPYMSEADDVFQSSLQTLEVTRGGDCDDYTILVCSLLRSIGYEVYIGLTPGHVYPGVILSRAYAQDIAKVREKLIKSGQKELASRLSQEKGVLFLRRVMVPLDRQLVEKPIVIPVPTRFNEFSGVTIGLLDIVSGALQKILIEIDGLIKSFVDAGRTELANELKKSVGDSLSKLSDVLMTYKYSRTVLIQCNGPRRFETHHIYDLFYEDIKQITESWG